MKIPSLLVVVAGAALAANSAFAADPVGTVISQWNFNAGDTIDPEVIAPGLLPSTGVGTFSFNPSAAGTSLGQKWDSSLGDIMGVDSGTGLPIYLEKAPGRIENNSSDPLSWVVGPGAVSLRYELQKFSMTAPSGTEYAQWMVPTTGQSHIIVDMDVRVKEYVARHFTIQYTTNGTTWANGLTIDARTAIPEGLTYGMCETVGDPPVGADLSLWFNNCTLDLSHVAAANNNPNFGFRFVPGKGLGENVSLEGTASEILSEGTMAKFKYAFDMVTVTSADFHWQGGDSSGVTKWGVAKNWAPDAAIPGGKGARVIFGGQAPANNVVELPAAGQTVGEIIFTTGTNTTIQGAAPLTLDNDTVAATIDVAGNHTISAPVALNSDVEINGTGSLTLAAGISGHHVMDVLGGSVVAKNIVVDSLSIADGSSVKISGGGGAGGTSVIGTLTIALPGGGAGQLGDGVNAVPEPSAFVLLGMGALGLLAYAWRRRRV